MNKLLIVAVLMAIFPIMQTFANEKAEVLPEENNIETPDFSMEESSQVAPKFSLDKKSVENKAYKAAKLTALGSIFLSYSGMMTLGFAPLSIFLLLRSGYLGIIASIGLSVFPIEFLIAGIIMLTRGIKIYEDKRQHCDDKILSEYYKTKIKNWETLSIIFGVVSGVGLVVGGIGAGMLCGGTINTFNKPLFITGTTLLCTGVWALLIGGLPVMIVSLAMSAWLKKQTNRFSVDIGVASGSTGELSCDKKRNNWELPNSIALSITVRAKLERTN